MQVEVCSTLIAFFSIIITSRIIFDFYTGLSHIYSYMYGWSICTVHYNSIII